MLLALVLLIIGVLTGRARGGRLENITTVRFRLPLLVFLGLGLQLGAELVAHLLPGSMRGATGPALLALSYGLVLAFVVLNIRFPGTILMGAGLLLNLTVILANHAMPVSPRAAQEAGIQSLVPRLHNEVKHNRMDHRTRLGFLGDVIPLPLLGVVSVGDIVLGAGVCLLVDRLVAPQPEPRPERKTGRERSPVRRPRPAPELGPGHGNRLPSNK